MSVGTSATVAIPFSKRKLALMLVSSIAFVVAGAWMWSIAESQPILDTIWLRTVGAAGVLFFGGCGAFACYKAVDRRPALMIDREGIVDNSSAVCAGRVPWRDIVDIRVSEIAGQRVLTIDVCDPQRYLERGGAMRRWLTAANTRLVGGPVNISASALGVRFDELVNLLVEALARHKRNEQRVAADGGRDLRLSGFNGARRGRRR
jgi:hypothetical protein